MFFVVKLVGTLVLGLLLYAGIYLLRHAFDYRLDAGILLAGIVLTLFSASLLLMMWVPNEKRRFAKLLGILENSGLILFFLCTSILMGSGSYLAIKDGSYGLASGAAVLFLGSVVIVVVLAVGSFQKKKAHPQSEQEDFHSR